MQPLHTRKNRPLTLLLAAVAATVGILGLGAAPAGGLASAETVFRPLQIARAVARHLDLTDAQRSAIKEVVRLHQPELQPLLDRSRVEHAALREIVAATPFDETALAAQADKVAVAHKDLVVAGARLRADIRSVLSADQLARLDVWRALAEERIDELRALFLDELAAP